MKELLIQGLNKEQIFRLLENRVSKVEVDYSCIKSVLYVQKSEGKGRIYFDNNDEWNFDFAGNSDAFLKTLSGL